MNDDPEFNLERAHRYFSAECFNRAWDMIDKPSRTPDEDRTMLQLGLASLWHWTQHPDHTLINLSMGNWQVSRIYALLGKADEARQYARASLELSQEAGDFPFYIGYAFEALARSESVAGDYAKKDEYLKLARLMSDKITDPEAKKQLLNDLAAFSDTTP